MYLRNNLEGYFHIKGEYNPLTNIYMYECMYVYSTCHTSNIKYDISATHKIEFK